MEEQAKRRIKSERMAEEEQAEPADLMVVEDPVILQRNRQIEQIKQMVMNNNSNNGRSDWAMRREWEHVLFKIENLG